VDFLDFITSAGSALPTLELLIGDGNWDAYGKSAMEVGIAFDNNLPADWGQQGIIDGIDYFFIRKRVSMIDFENAGAQNQSDTHLQVKKFFRSNTYSKLGIKSDAFADFEVRVDYQALLQSDLDVKLSVLITEIITHYQQEYPLGNMNPLVVLSKLLTYINPFSSVKVKKAANTFFLELTKVATLYNFSFHTEAGGGFAFGLKLANFTLTFNVLGLAVYHYDFIEEGNALIGEMQANEIRTFFNTPLVKQTLLFFVI
jgi:hypothetical protein